MADLFLIAGIIAVVCTPLFVLALIDEGIAWLRRR